ncbi:MAG: ATP-binding protein [Candidatus Omnitrophota bacterium]
MSDSIAALITSCNIVILLISCGRALKKRNIISLLVFCALLSTAFLEIAKLSLVFEFSSGGMLIGAGLCMFPLFWLVASVSLVPAKSYSLNRVVLSPLFGFLVLLFFLLWWIVPFIKDARINEPILFTKLGRYFFVTVVFTLALVLSNIERSVYYFKQKNIKWLFASALFILVPYVFIATYAVFFSHIRYDLLTAASFMTLPGALIMLKVLKTGYSLEAAREDTAVHASLSLFLIGGYLFFIGIFIKLFQVSGWNLQALFSLLTGLFIFFTLLYLLFSSSLRTGLKQVFFGNLTKRKHDWQKIWEEFTYNISLVHEMDEITERIKDIMIKTTNAKRASVFLFDKESPFEEGFLNWLLRYAWPLTIDEFLKKDLGNKFPKALDFLKTNKINLILPLYGDKCIIAIVGLWQEAEAAGGLDRDLLKVLSLQASSAIVSCRSYIEAADAQKKAALGKMAAFIVHDVKNYIHSLSLMAENKSKFSNPLFLEDALITLNSTISKMKELTDGFNALRKEIVLEKKECRLSEIIELALKDTAIDNFNAVEVEKILDKNSEVLADGRHLSRVFINIILNSLEAMNYKGKITVLVKSTSSKACVSISDNGPGMSKEFINNSLFKPFYSTKPKGFGIGLYQSKSIVEAHGGEIKVDSIPGKGTTFTIELPLAQYVTRTTNHEPRITNHDKWRQKWINY